MASYTVPAGHVGAQSKTLAINTVDTVTFGEDLDAVVVISDGAAALYFTVDGSTPSIGGDNTHTLPKGARATRQVNVATSGNTVVKLISSGAPTYSVEEGHDDNSGTTGVLTVQPAAGTVFAVALTEVDGGNAESSESQIDGGSA